MNIQSIGIYGIGYRSLHISLDNYFGIGMPMCRKSYFTFGTGFSLIYIADSDDITGGSFGPLLNICLSYTHLIKK